MNNQESTSRPDCYACKHRGTIPGDGHSCCQHPNNAAAIRYPLAHVIAMLAGVGRADPLAVETGLNIKANAHGIRMGWFNWPFNFDPVWLESCDGFEVAEARAEASQQ